MVGTWLAARPRPDPESYRVQNANRVADTWRPWQVNIASRDAALSPAASDTLAVFAGTYATHLLPDAEGGQVSAGAEVVVTVNSQGACWSCSVLETLPWCPGSQVARALRWVSLSTCRAASPDPPLAPIHRMGALPNRSMDSTDTRHRKQSDASCSGKAMHAPTP